MRARTAHRQQDSVIAIACYRRKKRGEQNRRELAAVATGIDLRFRRHVFRDEHWCLSLPWLLPSLPPLYSFLRKRSSLIVNICLIAAAPPRRNLLLETKIARPSGSAGPCQWRPRNGRNGHYAPADRVTEITKILSHLPASPAHTSLPSAVQNSARVCTHRQCSYAIWTLRPAIFGACRSSALDSISRASSVTQRGQTRIRGFTILHKISGIIWA